MGLNCFQEEKQKKKVFLDIFTRSCKLKFGEMQINFLLIYTTPLSIHSRGTTSALHKQEKGGLDQIRGGFERQGENIYIYFQFLDYQRIEKRGFKS